MKIVLQRSTRDDKKFMIIADDKTVHFGAKGYSDYTLHKDRNRMRRYVDRHRSREDWTKKGILTAGFWSRWLLWNKPSFCDSKKDIEKRFGVKIIDKTRRCS